MNFNSGGGGNVNEAGTYTVSKSQTVASTTIQGYYERPLTLESAFVRVTTTSTAPQSTAAAWITPWQFLP